MRYIHNFETCLKESHINDSLPYWNECYKLIFPEMIGSLNHRDDGEHQRAGIDRSIILKNSKQILIDEKVRHRNKLTGKVYQDIALEYLHKYKNGVTRQGWVEKELRADYIAYAIPPLGKLYLLPTVQLRRAWFKNKENWIKEFRTVIAENQGFQSLSLCVPVGIVYKAIGNAHLTNFNPIEE